MTDKQEKNLSFYRQWRSQDRTIKNVKSTKSKALNKSGIELQDVVQSHAKHAGNIPTYNVEKAKPIKNPKLALAEIRDVEQALATLPPEKRAKHQAQIEKLRLLIAGKKVSLQETEAQIQSFKKAVARQAPSKDSTKLEKNVKKQLKSKDKKLPKTLLKAGIAAGAAGAAVVAAQQVMSSTTKAAKTMHVKASNLNRPIGAHSSGKGSELSDAASQANDRSLASNANNGNGIGSSGKGAGNDTPKQFMPTQQNSAGANGAGKPGAGKGKPDGGDKPGGKPKAGKGGDKPPKGGDKPGGGPKPPKPPKPPKGGGAAAGAIGGIIGGIAGAIGGAAGSIIGGDGNDGNNGENGNPGNPGNIDDLKKKIEELEKELKKQKEAQKKLEEEVKKNKEQIEEQKKQLEEAKKQIEETQKQLAEAVKQFQDALKKMGKEVESGFKQLTLMGLLGAAGLIAITDNPIRDGVIFLGKQAWEGTKFVGGKIAEGAKGLYNVTTGDVGDVGIGEQTSLQPIDDCPNCDDTPSKNKPFVSKEQQQQMSKDALKQVQDAHGDAPKLEVPELEQ